MKDLVNQPTLFPTLRMRTYDHDRLSRKQKQTCGNKQHMTWNYDCSESFTTSLNFTLYLR